MATDLVKDEEKIGGRPDMKKQVVEDLEGVKQRNNNQINSDAEKTVVRKLDWRIVTLLVILCPFPPFINIRYFYKLNYQRPDLLSTLDRSNIGYDSCCEVVTTGTVIAYC